VNEFPKLEQEPAPTTLETVTGWGDIDIPTEVAEPVETSPQEGDTNDAVNQASTEPFGQDSTGKADSSQEKKTPVTYKSFEEYQKEQLGKKNELEKLLVQMSIPTPVPRKLVESDETGGRYVDVQRNIEDKEKAKKARAPKAPASQPPTQQVQTKPIVTVESFFNFAADPRETRRRFNQDSELEQQPEGKFKTKKNTNDNTDANTNITTEANTNNNESQSPQLHQSDSNRKGRRGRGVGGGNGGGRGGQGRSGGGQGRGGAGRGRRFNSSGGRAFNRGSGGIPLPTQPEDWPELV